MSERDPSTPPPAGGRPAPPGPARLVLAGVLLAVAIVVPLLTWTYARETPDLGGVPFFFWYQFVLVVASVAFTWISYRLVLSHEADRRSSEGLPGPGGEGQ